MGGQGGKSKKATGNQGSAPNEQALRERFRTKIAPTLRSPTNNESDLVSVGREATTDQLHRLKGTRVTLNSGPWKGTSGIVTSVDGNKRSVRIQGGTSLTVTRDELDLA